MTDGPRLNQVNLVVRDMDAAVSFYRCLGLPIEAAPGAHHVAVPLENGLVLELDHVDFASTWDTGSRGEVGGAAVLGFALGTRDAVDRAYAQLVATGAVGRQPPYDAFWGARYAIVEDPDGHPVGLMSPVDEAARFWPPSVPPRAVTTQARPDA